MKKQVISSFLVAALLFTSVSPALGQTTKKPVTPKQVVEKLIKLKDFTINPQNNLPSVPDSLDKTQYLAEEKGLYLVQFTGPIQEHWKQELTGKGVVIGEYIPENSFIAKMTSASQKVVAGLDFIQNISIYKPAYKIDNDLKDTNGNIDMKGSAGTKEVTVDISLFPDADNKSLTALLTKINAQVKEKKGDKVFLTVSREQLDQLAFNNDITYIEETPTWQLFNEKAASIIGAPALWSNSLQGNGQVIGITDTGLDTGKNDSSMHQDFQGKIESLISLNGNSTADSHGHGTHVAGSVLGNGARSNGTNKGVAPQARLVFQAAGTNLSGIPSDLGQLFAQAYNAGARIHSNSWGGSADGRYDSRARSVDNYVWNNDMTVLFAAGNSGGTNTIATPGTAKNAITVGASENNRPEKGSYSDNINSVASFSSRGYTADGRIKPDVVAPGTNILSTKSSLTSGSGYYTTMSGTSMATPITAGAVALVRQYFMEKQNITPKPSLLKAALINGAVDMGYGYGNRDQGWGRINISNSSFPTSPKEMRFINETTALTTGGSKEYTYQVESSGTPLKVSLVWTDYPGSTAASKALVNDLDIKVISPSGTEFNGNDFSTPYNSQTDRLNNVENVLISTPTAGTYRVIVSAYNVPSGPQDYSMVVNGDLSSGTQPQPQPVPDTLAPTVNITSPANGAVISGTVVTKANATDDKGVSKVEFSVDGSLKFTDAAAPFEYTLDSTSLSNGQHQISAKAYDAAGNTSIATIQVSVNNSSSSDAGTTTVQGFLNAASSSTKYKDYYLDTTSTGEINLNLSWPETADLDLYLYNPAGTLVAKSAALSNPENIKYHASTVGRYRVKVNAYSGSANYNLTMSYPGGNVPPAPPTEENIYTDTKDITSKTGSDYSFTVANSGSLSAEVSWDNASADLDVYLYNQNGTLISKADTSSANPEKFTASVTPGTYQVKIYSYSGNARYNLKVSYPK